MSIMIYGATGYTGRLALETAVEMGLKPIAAGRNAENVGREAERLGLDFRVFDLKDPAEVTCSLRGVRAVLNCAGPYSATARTMAEACIEAGAHYVDVTAENEVIKDLQSMDAVARAANVMLLPAVGAGGGPTDCLATHLKSRLPDATHLEYFGGSLEVVSRGTAKSAMEAVHRKIEVRREGELVELDQALRVAIELDGGTRRCVTVPLCDVLVAHWSTQIPNITTYVEEAGAVEQMSSVPQWAKRLLGTRVGQRLVAWLLDRGVEGPTEEERAAGSYRNLGIARNDRGDRVASEALGPEGYTFTALSAVSAARRAADGEFKSGYQTASSAYGVDYFTSLEGCRIEDLDPPHVTQE